MLTGLLNINVDSNTDMFKKEIDFVSDCDMNTVLIIVMVSTTGGG